MVDSGKEIETRCYHCAGPLTKNLETNEWTVAPFIRDSFCMIGSAVGGTASAFIGFNHVMPIVRKCIKGPMWLHFLVGAPPVIAGSTCDSCFHQPVLDLQVALYRLWHSLPRRRTMQLFIHLSLHKCKRRTKYISHSFV